MKRLMQDSAQPGRVLHKVIVLGAVAGDADSVGLLKRVGADEGRRHLSGDDDHRDRIHECVGNTGNRICRTGTACHQHHARLAGGARVTLCSVRRGLFVTNKNMLDPFLLEQRVINREHRAARIAKDDFHAEIDKRLNEDFGSGAFGRHEAFLCCSAAR